MAPHGSSLLEGDVALGDLEQAVMEELWAADRPLTVRDVLELVGPSRPLAYTTVMTIMDRLHRKGLLSRTREGKAYLYQPTAGRDVYIAELMTSVLQSADGGTGALIHFAERLSSAEASVLKDALARARRRRGGAG